MLNLCDNEFFLVLTAHRFLYTIQSSHNSQREKKIIIIKFISIVYSLFAILLIRRRSMSVPVDAMPLCVRLRRSPTHILQITWIDGSENVLTEGVEYVKEPSSSDSRRFTAKSILKLKANKDYHNKTIICQAQNSVDKTYRSAAIRLEVRWIYIFFNEHNTPPPSSFSLSLSPSHNHFTCIRVSPTCVRVHLFPVCLYVLFVSEFNFRIAVTKTPVEKMSIQRKNGICSTPGWQKVLMRKCRCRRQIDTQTRIDVANCFNLFLMLTSMIRLCRFRSSMRQN